MASGISIHIVRDLSQCLLKTSSDKETWPFPAASCRPENPGFKKDLYSRYRPENLKEVLS